MKVCGNCPRTRNSAQIILKIKIDEISILVYSYRLIEAPWRHRGMSDVDPPGLALLIIIEIGTNELHVGPSIYPGHRRVGPW